ncbi:MAG TPA: ATP-binding protein [Mucilaginibacter sp.]|jgi:signal transduction histidine kinase|nr:ATP-binding protein [Mucilaginibacter sp.]
MRSKFYVTFFIVTLILPALCAAGLNDNTYTLGIRRAATFLTVTHLNIKTADKYHYKKTSLKDTSLSEAEQLLHEAVNVKNWSAAARICLKLADLNSNYKSDEAIKYNVQGVEFARKAADINLESDNLMGLGAKYLTKFDYALAIENYLKALKLCPRLNQKKKESRINRTISEIYFDVEEYDKSEPYLLKAMQEDQQINYTSSIVFFFMGRLKLVQGKYQESLDYYKRYLIEVPEESNRVAQAYLGLGSIYMWLHDFDKCAIYTRNADQILDSVKNPDLQIYCKVNFGNIARAQHDYKLAIQFASQALKLAQTIKFRGAEKSIYQLLAYCYYDTENYRLAYIYTGKYVAIRDSVNARTSFERIQVSEAVYRVDMETEKNTQQILSLNKDNDLKKLQIANLVNKNRIDQLRMANLNKERSLTKLKLYNLRQKDSLNRLKLANYNKANIVNGMRLQSLNQQNQLKNLKIVVQGRNQLLLVIGTTLLLFAFIVYYRRYRFKKLLEMEKIRSDIAADFHDELGSALSSIALYSEIAMNNNFADAQRTKSILSMIGESSRGTVSAMQDMIWTIQPKNDNMQEVVYRMREYAYPLAELKDICLKLDVDEDVLKLVLSMDTRKNIYLIFKEALNNAFKYASASNIFINMTKRYSLLIMEIKDDGAGFDLSNAKTGNGLRNMHKRAEQAGGTLFIKSDNENGTEILFNCPVS